MTINPRTKGQEGEREIARMLNEIYCTVLKDLNQSIPEDRDLPFQRNQNQSAVGGSDLSNPFGLSIEVKRQEQLSVSTWWIQCVESAMRTSETPILLYRQNRKGWRCVMYADVPFDPFNRIVLGSCRKLRVELNIEDFRYWMMQYLHTRLG